MKAFWPLLRAWLGQKTTIHGLATMVAIAVLLATRQINQAMAEAGFSGTLVLLLGPENTRPKAESQTPSAQPAQGGAAAPPDPPVAS